ncbi:2-amino-4-hydroxy-6-hydroxymethyldihydropteridine diphosphokinase [Chryseobacterium sp. HSC-36S06]|uniref:2-amino-4-hydroxy-6- hydroxymethyldihydropteridine diphosphokinase n=1 Tax=Chryseobacterium sp. HSC-36S06 TaxID=2910970 RepID=UPI0020A072C2|nr:2-amino-4-hydroxy-6-hydroxymethyldihydropteridine diphosphokinase [Chryseobacterium sp. HSC-36S06]MCP2038993.1 2-amino-4-hydroxy-6-hydroxymethyldihydropteridine diphosphokinase [Chryseobacterium sp. HSC-36S06]
MSHHLVTLLLGSNLGKQKDNIDLAISRIEEEVGELVGQSEIIYTKPVEFVSNNIFCNIALRIKTQFSPIKLLNLVKKIEVEMGRTDDSLITKGYADRVIDIDIVFYGNMNFSSLRLEIPHSKHVYEREFSKKLLLSI